MAENIAFDHSRRMDENAIRMSYFFPAVIIMSIMAAVLGGLMSYNPAAVGRVATSMGSWKIFLPFLILLVGPAIGTQLREYLFIRDLYINHGGKRSVRGNKEALVHIDSNSAWNDSNTFRAMLLAWVLAMSYGAVLIKTIGRLSEYQGDDRWWIALGNLVLFVGIALFAAWYNRFLQDFQSNGNSSERGTCSVCKRDSVYLLLDPMERRMRFITKWVWRIAFLVIGFVSSAIIFGYQSETVAMLVEWGLVNG